MPDSAVSHQRCPQYPGDELSANLIYATLEREGRQLSADSLEQTYHQLWSEGLIDGGDNPSYDAVRDEPEPETDVVEYVWEDEPQPTREDFEALSNDELRSLIKQHDEPSTPKSIDEEIDLLSLQELGQLIIKAGGR